MNILIIEDEKVAARRLQRMLMRALDKQIGEIFIEATLSSSIALTQREEIDLLFLDLNINGEDGFEVLRTLRKRDFQTIVVSATTDRAIEAFELGVIDFVPKPYDEERLSLALNRYTGRINRTQGISTLIVKNQGSRQFVPLTTINYIKGAKDYSEIHCEGGGVHLYNRSLEVLSEQLPENFIRVHKSFIINKTSMQEVKVFGGGKYQARLSTGEDIPISRSKYKELFSDS